MIRNSRKHAITQRLQNRLQAKTESLADQFEFRIYIAFIFEDPSKTAIVYRTTDVIPVMNNNYESLLLDATKRSPSSNDCAKELLREDIVQLHSQKYCHLNKDRFSTEKFLNFLLWPRSDIKKISCSVFSRWKNESKPFKHLQDFSICSEEYTQQILKLAEHRSAEFVLNNDQHRMFMLIHRHPASGSRPEYCSLSGICLFLSQEKLYCWDKTSEDDVLQEFGAKLSISI